MGSFDRGPLLIEVALDVDYTNPQPAKKRVFHRRVVCEWPGPTGGDRKKLRRLSSMARLRFYTYH